jgi:hypothetical protein
MQRTVFCPGANSGRGAWVPLGAYVAGVKLAIENPDMEFKHGLTSEFSTTGRSIRYEFWLGVQDRINQGISYSKRGME